MNTKGKLLLFAIAALIAVSFSSCLVRSSPHKKWNKRYDRGYRYKGNSGRRLWVRDTYKNTR